MLTESEIKALYQGSPHHTLIVNAFGGAGAGKTTACLHITSELKKQGYIAEYVSEYAKDLVWDRNFEMLDGALEHQRAILEEQSKRIDRYLGQVDFVVTDSPLLLNGVYLKECAEKEQYCADLQRKFDTYENFNVVIQRDTHKFEQEGRIHTLSESIEIDNSVEQLLNDNHLFYGKYSHEMLDKIVKNIISTHTRISKTNIEKGEDIMSKTAKFGVNPSELGNQEDIIIKSDLNNKFANAIAEEMSKNNVPFSIIVEDKTTLAFNIKDEKEYHKAFDTVKASLANMYLGCKISELSENTSERKFNSVHAEAVCKQLNADKIKYSGFVNGKVTIITYNTDEKDKFYASVNKSLQTMKLTATHAENVAKQLKEDGVVFTKRPFDEKNTIITVRKDDMDAYNKSLAVVKETYAAANIGNTSYDELGSREECQTYRLNAAHAENVVKQLKDENIKFCAVPVQDTLTVITVNKADTSAYEKAVAVVKEGYAAKNVDKANEFATKFASKAAEEKTAKKATEAPKQTEQKNTIASSSRKKH